MKKRRRKAFAFCAAFAIVSLHQASAQTGSAAYWTFDETSDSPCVDWSDNGNTGYLHSATRVPGVKGHALSFGGAASYVYVNNSPSLNISGQVTLECWVNVRQINPVSGAGQTIIRKENSYVIGIGSGGRVGFWIHTTAGWNGSWTFSQQSIQANCWNHIVGVWNGQTLKVYINGVQDLASLPVSGVVDANNNLVYMGKFYESAYEDLNGSIDEVAIYKYALSADSVVAHFRAIRPGLVAIPYSPNPTYNQRPLLRWYANKSMLVYRVQIAANPFFDSPIVSVPLSDTSYTPLANLAVGTLYWRVGNDADPSIWSQVLSITILDPNVPLLIHCAPDPTRNRRPLLVWHPVKGSTVYTVQIDTSPDFLSPFIADAVADTAYQTAISLPIGTAYWRVKSNMGGQFSIPDTFRILNDSIPLVIQMAPDTQYISKPKFLWHPAPGASSYRLQIDTAGYFIDPLISLPVNDTSYSPLVDLPIGKIVWRVSASTNQTRYSDPDTFWVLAKSTVTSGHATNLPLTVSGTLDAVRNGTLVMYSLDKPGDVSLRVFSMKGSCLATLYAGTATAGMHTLAWRGTDRFGKPVPNGSYLAVFSIDGRSFTKKIMLLR